MEHPGFTIRSRATRPFIGAFQTVMEHLVPKLKESPGVDCRFSVT